MSWLVEIQPRTVATLLALFVLPHIGPVHGQESLSKETIGRYLATEPIENLRIQPNALRDDPREDFYFTVDVRTPQEFKDGHIRGAINLPYYELTSHLDRLPSDRGEPILVYCEAAQRSTHALMALRLLGFDNVWYLNGGTTRWQREGRPLSSSSANSKQP